MLVSPVATQMRVAAPTPSIASALLKHGGQLPQPATSPHRTPPPRRPGVRQSTRQTASPRLPTQVQLLPGRPDQQQPAAARIAFATQRHPLRASPDHSACGTCPRWPPASHAGGKCDSRHAAAFIRSYSQTSLSVSSRLRRFRPPPLPAFRS